ncbi:MAG: YigZ family protein [Pseudomonas sp.]|uniref:IMPACT family protein n=1 Tax=Pseudomonas sp. TaxID=306 RepID=UPI003399D2F9
MPVTLAIAAEYREEIRKSRFIAQAVPIEHPGEVAGWLERLGDRAASHNCWAWKVGAQCRFSDDGEPGGTAGRPILAAIEGQDCDQVLVLVTRWYGGIQLGTGGLARAYGGSANKCLQTAERRELLQLTRCSCQCGFAELPLLKARLAQFQAQLEGERFDATGAELSLALPAEQIAGLARVLADISRGRAQLRLG